MWTVLTLSVSYTSARTHDLLSGCKLSGKSLSSGFVGGRCIPSADPIPTVVLGTSGSQVALTIPRVDVRKGESISVSVAADEILLSTAEPVNLSARNHIPAQLESIQSVDHRCLITARICPDLPPVVIELTADAIEDLHLVPGASVYLLIKTSSVTVYA